MAGGLTYANTLGSINGINQSGSGVTIPDTFLRWAQDVLFDNNGALRRRSPWSIFRFSVSADNPKYSGSTESFSISSIAYSSPTVTLTFPSTPAHNFTIGQPIIVSDVSVAGYNGSFVVTATTATTISYEKTGLTTPATGGSVTSGNERIISTISTVNPNGDRVTGMILRSANKARILFYDKNFVGPYVSQLSVSLDDDNIFDCKQASTKGMWLGFLKSYATGTAANPYSQYYWRGGCGTETTYSGAITITNSAGGTGWAAAATASYGNVITMPSTTVVPSPGMFVYLSKGGNDYFAGVVASATSTTITLEKNLIRPVQENAFSGLGTQAGGLGYSIKTVNVRPYIKNHSRGLLSVTTGVSAPFISGDEGTDGEGHWFSAGIASGWAVYRNSDNLWLGDIASVTDNTTMIGHATWYPAASITMTADEYIARPYGVVPSPNLTSRSDTTSAGIFTAAYAGLQWYGNSGTSSGRNRIVFSNYTNCESVDLSANAADSIIIPSLNEMRGLASSSSGLLIFMADKTFILRGNSRFNFSLEELYPEGCLSSMSIVEYGGGVFWASKTGIYYYDGTTVRNLTSVNLGNYYSQSLSKFNPISDRVYGFFYRDYLFMHFTSWKSMFNPVRYEPIYADGVETSPAITDFTIDDWDPDFTPDDFKLDSNTPLYWSYNKMYAGGSTSAAIISSSSDVWNGAGAIWGTATSPLLWGPPDAVEGFTIAIYLPTEAITILSNFGFRGVAKVETDSGMLALTGINIVNAPLTFPRMLDVGSIFTADTVYDNSLDEELVENIGIADANYYKGPDFFIQTKQYTMGDPLLKKWFRQLFLNLYLIDGSLRLDIVDNEDHDDVDIRKKRHKNWDLFTSISYSWDQLESLVLPKLLSPDRSTWGNVEGLNLRWFELTSTAFERRKMRFSWRNANFGFRLYQLNKYRPSYSTQVEQPFSMILESWDIGFKPMRQSRV